MRQHANDIWRSTVAAALLVSLALAAPATAQVRPAPTAQGGRFSIGNLARSLISRLPSRATLKTYTTGWAMTNTIRSGNTPAVQLIAARQPDLLVEGKAGYRYHPEMITRLGVDRCDITRTGGVLDATLLLPVSGHVGKTLAERAANARRYAVEDRMQVTVKHPDGTTSTLLEDYEPKKRLVSKVQVKIPLQPGLNRLEFNPHPGKTAGTAGFPVGRAIEILVRDSR